MNYKMMSKFIGKILAVEVAFMVPALLISVFSGETATAVAFLQAMLIICLVSGVLLWYGRNSKKKFYAKEGLICVAMSWIGMSMLGCLPFVFSGEIPHYVDALFEMVSGFTTTGASVVASVEDLSKGILYWRSFSHWVGGMGVLVFVLAISSFAGGDNGYTMHLLRAESPGPDVGKLVPKMKQTAGILYWIYIVLTIVNILFLIAGNMPVFEAVCTGLGTAGTGGFGIKNDGLAGYSPYIQNVTTVFMWLFGVNFTCYYLLLLKQVKNVFKDEELRLYFWMVVGCIVLIVWDLRGYYETMGETIRHAAFQVSSIVTTTGYATTDFNLWPNFSKTILLGLMIVGACAGSTGGGFKCIRLLLILKNLRRSIRQVVRPQKIQAVRSNGKSVEEKVLAGANAYLAAYAVILAGSMLLVSIDGFSIETNLSVVLSCFNNIGPGLDVAGPMSNYGGFSIFTKLVLIFDMLAGRLELFPILILFSGSTWKHR